MNHAKYHRLAGAESTSVLADDFIELRPRNRRSSDESQGNFATKQPTTNARATINHQINDGETLAQIALKYSLQIAEIKRANNIVSDQEIFGLRSLKIPVSQNYFVQRMLLDTNTSDEKIIISAESQGTTKIITDSGATEDLISPTFPIENGVFHFIDATSPDATRTNIWILIGVVVFIFVLIPLIITLLEENGEFSQN